WRVMHLERLRQSEGCCWLQVLMERTGVVRIQVVLHQHHLFGYGEHLRYSLHAAAVVSFGSLSARLDNALSRQRLESNQEDGCPLPLVFVIEAAVLVFLHRQGGAHFAQQLHGQLVEADDGSLLIIGEVIEMQDSLHPRQIFASDLPDAPLPFQVRLESVFFRISLTALCETLSQKPSLTLRSANRRSVQRACPSGASEQARGLCCKKYVPGYNPFFS